MVDQPDWTSATLLKRICDGESSAANAIFSRYATRLILLARSRLSPSIASRLDPEDVALSAWRSFFVAARHGRFELEAPGDLWRLLAGITLHKLSHQARFHQAARRSVRRTQALNEPSRLAVALLDRQPTVEDVVALADELGAIMAPLKSQARRVLELRLQGKQIADIANELNCSERTVRRMLSRIRVLVATRFDLQSGQKPPSPVRYRGSQPKRSRKSRVLSTPLPRNESALLTPGEFILERMLGAGRFGKVYRARRYRDNATVAIKYLRKSYLTEPLIVERFLREARTLAALDHPGIVGITGLGITPAGSYFLVMDWVDGPNLAEVLRSGLPSIDRVVRWMLELSNAIEHAHARGILHCDLKPGNVMVDRNDAIHVTDFGLARPIIGDPELDGRVEGTPAFMAPEQASARWGSIGIHTDVYGLGAVCYALLTGQAPRATNSRREVLNEMLAPTPVIDPGLLRADIPEGLARICVRCLSSTPAARYQTVGELRGALDELS